MPDIRVNALLASSGLPAVGVADAPAFPVVDWGVGGLLFGALAAGAPW
ncbi:hypothetical protein [Streptomyces sp. NPDC096012]